MSLTYVDVDYSARVSALIRVGTALGAPNTILPAPWASPGEFLCLQYINNLRVFMGEAPLTNLDYTGFQAALNALAALGTPPVNPPVNTVVPIVSGVGTVGSMLTCTSGTWTNSPTLTYQWGSAGVNVPGATGTTYVLQASDSGNNVDCQVTGTNLGGTATITSNAVLCA
jgi:hypothetical protein